MPNRASRSGESLPIPAVVVGHRGLARAAYECHDLAAARELEHARGLLEREGNLEGTYELEE